METKAKMMSEERISKPYDCMGCTQDLKSRQKTGHVRRSCYCAAQLLAMTKESLSYPLTCQGTKQATHTI
jgi:hypothetical protein